MQSFFERGLSLQEKKKEQLAAQASAEQGRTYDLNVVFAYFVFVVFLVFLVFLRKRPVKW